MFYESSSIIGTKQDRLAELHLRDRFTFEMWTELVTVAEAAARDPFIEVIFVSGHFDELREHDADSRWQQGYDLFRRWQALPVPTVALAHGAIRGAGYEFLQGVDLRLAVATADSWVQPSAEWLPISKHQATLTAREAVKLKLLDDAYTERQAKVETRLHLDHLLRHPVKRRPRHPLRMLTKKRSDDATTRLPITASSPRPTTVALIDAGLLGCRVAVETLLRGGSVIVCSDANLPLIESILNEAVSRGRVTPLEAEQARRRINRGELADARWVLTASPEAVEVVRAQLHPWVTVSDEANLSWDAYAWCDQLGVANDPALTLSARFGADYTSERTLTKLAS